MLLTPEHIAKAKTVAEAHKLKEVFLTEKGEFFSTIREARNSKAKEVVRAFPAPSIKEVAEEAKDVTVDTTEAKPTLDAQNGNEDDPEKVEPEPETAIETIVEPEPVVEPETVEPEVKAPKSVKPKPVV